jgi:WD40 repeat protein
MRVGRPWGFLVYFLFVISLAVVSATSSPWVRRGSLPGHVFVVNYEHGTALIALENAGDEPRRALLDIASLTITHPVVDAKPPYGEPVFLPAERRVAFSEFRLQESTATCRVVDLDTGAAYILLDNRPLRVPGLDPSGQRLVTSEERRVLILDAGTGETMASLPLVSPGYGVWLPGGSTVLVHAGNGGTVHLWDTKSASVSCTLETKIGSEYSVIRPARNSRLAILWNVKSGPGVLIDTRECKVIRPVEFGEGGGSDRSRLSQCAMFGLGEQRIVTVDRDDVVRVTETMTGKALAGIHQAQGRLGIVVSIDGTRLAVDTGDEIVIVDLETCRTLTRVALARDSYDMSMPGLHQLSFSDEFLVWNRDVYRRRFPEWWWGHFYRLEVWAAIVLGIAWLWSVARWARGRMKERRAGWPGATPASA